MDVERYCRDLEAYLCRKNDGHLIRVVGPAFERVCAWADRGIPFNIACRGIDRCFERYYARDPRGARRRPVRIEFCEADILDLFDEWRRAVGVGGSAEPAARRGPSLPEHLERAIARLTALRTGTNRAIDDQLDGMIRELDAVRSGERAVRGAAREAVLRRLAEIDATLVAAYRQRCTPAELDGFAREADAELAPFRERMPREAYAGAHNACVDRLIRDRHRLPTLAFE